MILRPCRLIQSHSQYIPTEGKIPHNKNMVSYAKTTLRLLMFHLKSTRYWQWSSHFWVYFAFQQTDVFIFCFYQNTAS